MLLLQGKVAVIYGAGDGIGGAVAKAFASEGATVHVTARRAAPVESLAAEINGAGGIALPAVVDALDEAAIDAHLDTVVARDKRVDISFNAIGITNAAIVGTPLATISAENFALAMRTYVNSYFLTARLAARRMMPQRAGVIMTVTALHSRIGLPLVGGYGPAMAAKEALTRDLSAELASSGIRVVGLRPQGMPETRTIRDAYEPRAKASGMTWDEWQAFLAARTHTKRLMSLTEMANMAAFLASDRASGMTGTTVNLTMGSMDD
jgi:NAD(P)-dependent dehydrogenase (short-subunit alcohol dehydrogenase family)